MNEKQILVSEEQAIAVAFLMEQNYSKEQIIEDAMDGVWCKEPNEPNIQVLNGLDKTTLRHLVDGHFKVDEQTVRGIGKKVDFTVTLKQYEQSQVIGVSSIITFDEQRIEVSSIESISVDKGKVVIQGIGQVV